MSGYDVKKFIDQGVHYFWNESYGQIYPMLKSFVEEGLATVEKEEQEGKPDKNIYSVTEAGIEQLRQWLVSPPEDMPVRYEFLLKLYFGNHVGADVIISHLDDFKKDHEQKQAIFNDIEQHLMHVCTEHPEKIYSLMTVRFGIRECEMRLKWVDETKKQLLLHKENQGFTKKKGA